MHRCVCVFDDTFAHHITYVFHYFSPHRSKQTMTRRMDDWMDDETDG